MKSGRFREDLYYRLTVIRIQLPPLRDRFEDIPLLAQHFLVRFAAKNNREIRGFSPEALEALCAWRWPGNVRELENAMERAVVLCKGGVIGVDDLPPAMRTSVARLQIAFQVGTPLKDIERRMIEETLRYCGGDKTLTASLLGITARTIYRREAEWYPDREQTEPGSDEGP